MSGGAPPWVIPLAEVEVVTGVEGVIGRGALGGVRRGMHHGVIVALKSLYLLRTNATAITQMGVALFA
jgi:hypothetical protein